MFELAGGGDRVKDAEGCGLPVLSCSSARRRVSRRRRSERLGGRGIGGRCGRGTEDVRGDEGREEDGGLDLERERVLEGKGGDMGLEDITGVGAWTCNDMARVGSARDGTRPRLKVKVWGGTSGEDLSVVMGSSRGQYLIANAGS